MTQYIFDACSLNVIIKSFYEKRFPTFWEKFDELANNKTIISIKEVKRELERKFHNSEIPILTRTSITVPFFEILIPSELLIMKDILSVKHFQGLITLNNIFDGAPVADPFLIAKAEACNGVVVTEEVHKPNANKIPNVCEKRNVRCINLEKFMEEQNWSF